MRLKSFNLLRMHGVVQDYDVIVLLHPHAEAVGEGLYSSDYVRPMSIDNHLSLNWLLYNLNH